MIIDVVDSTGSPFRLHVTQIVIRNSQGTPIGVAVEYGPDGAQKIGHVGDPDFQQVLSGLGVSDHHVIATEIKGSDVPRGASLLRPSSSLPTG